MPKIVDHDAKRIEILDGSFSLFAQHGYNKLSMRQMASSLGVTTGTLYHYFDGKQQIFEELFALLQERDIQKVTEQFTAQMAVEERLLILKEFVTLEVSRLADVLRIALEYQRVQSADGRVQAVDDLIEGYRMALSKHLRLPDSLNQMVLSLIFGILVQFIFNPENNISAQIELGFSILQTLMNRT